MIGMISEAAFSTIFEGLLSSQPRRLSAHEIVSIGREVRCHQGRPDYVVVSTSGDVKARRERCVLAREMDTPVAARICASLYGERPRGRKFLSMSAGTGQSSFVRHLNILLEKGVIIEVRPDSYVLSPELSIGQVDLHAFELKITNWRRALFQAIQYRAFAHRVSVVVPSISGHLIERQLSRFTKLGIGVASIDPESGSIEILAKATRRRPYYKSHFFYTLAHTLRNEYGGPEHLTIDCEQRPMEDERSFYDSTVKELWVSA